MKIEEIFTFENLYKAYKDCRKSKQHKGEVIRFEVDLSRNIINLQKELLSKKYKLSDTKKSFAGSLTMFLIAFILIGGYLAFINSNVFWKSTHWILISAMMAFVVTGVEAVSGKGWDNLTVPISTLLLLILI